MSNVFKTIAKELFAEEDPIELIRTLTHLQKQIRAFTHKHGSSVADLHHSASIDSLIIHVANLNEHLSLEAMSEGGVKLDRFIDSKLVKDAATIAEAERLLNSSQTQTSN